MYVFVAVVSVIYAASVASVQVDQGTAEMRQAAAFFTPNKSGN